MRFCWIAVVLTAAGASANPLAPPPDAAIAEARVIVARMVGSERGPYRRIRWFCNDGSVHPPQPYPCRERGGGRQHAEYSDDRARLATLGWSVGTIFVELGFDELWDAERRHSRLRELPLERYLVDTLDGWVLKRAQNYRGRVQVEDEERAGRALLLTMLGDPDWVDENYLLARETARVIPHGLQTDVSRRVRRQAQALADRDPAFQSLRIEIHNNPSSATANRVRSWAGGRENPTVVQDTLQLAVDLDTVYGAAGRARRLSEAARELSTHVALADIARRLAAPLEETPAARHTRLAEALYESRILARRVEAPAIRLLLLDVGGEIEAELRLVTSELLSGDVTRRDLIDATYELMRASYGAGLVTEQELHAVQASLTRVSLTGPDAVAALDLYADAVRNLNLVIGWGAGAVRHAFAEPLARYTALDPRAGRFVDDLLRGSILLSLSDTIGPLAYDVQALSGVARQLGERRVPGLIGLNPGMSRGTLRLAAEDELSTGGQFGRGDIVLLPQTINELTPVAGVLTRGEGNLLSHVQLLTRNFGIPNVAVGPTEASLLEPWAGHDILLAAGSDGSVVVERVDALPGEVLELLAAAAPAEGLVVPPVDLTVQVPLPLDDVHKGLSGKVVGPKAANLGELNRMFPGRVAPAIAIPFGVFARHFNAGEQALLARLERAYAANRGGTLSDEQLRTALDEIRAEIVRTPLDAAARHALMPMMNELFGAPDSYGVFVRSDTNVEDLPGFSGAGLSETLPNVRGLDAQVAAVSTVWGSLLSPRAVAWRSNLLVRPAEVYASVLLMKSVPTDKSGVLVTTDIVTRGPGLTVSTAWGAGGAVAGEAAETLVLLPDGGERLIGQAKAPYRRVLADAGGIDWTPAPQGAVLNDADKQALRELAGAVRSRYEPAPGPDGAPMPWDVEFGFVNGELTLFQIRPLVERGQMRADRILGALLGPRVAVAESVALDERPQAAGASR